jgi:hypothetical protein
MKIDRIKLYAMCLDYDVAGFMSDELKSSKCSVLELCL